MGVIAKRNGARDEDSKGKPPASLAEGFLQRRKVRRRGVSH